MSNKHSTVVNPIDGTSIAATRIGEGRPVVIVHGSIADGSQWDLVAQELAADAESWLVDRRGRGLSGDATEHSLALEAADVAAMLAEAGPDAVLVAHSYGAIVALEALRSGATAAAAVIYEPPLPVVGPVAGAALEPFAALVAEGNLDDALALALTEVVHVPAEVVAGMRQSPAWAPMAALAPTWVRELRAIDALEPSAQAYATITTPLHFLLGEVTAPHHVAATDALRELLPTSTLTVLPGQEHFAHMAVPDQVAAVIRTALA
ncbi:alpha/beta hydrolase [Nocardioides sp.]|uniref:alpha/beta fold hydrolase n=1 Tax=Nocardioides sp. TaxID=35761 RepID=UPI00262629F2|nr:alpha/beta hydrolase [Nocardioides sp.]